MPDIEPTPAEVQEAIQNYSEAIRNISETFLDKGTDPRTLAMVLGRTADALNDVYRAGIVTTIVADAISQAFAKAGIRPEPTTTT